MKKKKAVLPLPDHSKATLWEIVESWDGVSARLKTIAKRQNENKDYFTAAENSWMADCMSMCADQLREILPDKEKAPNQSARPNAHNPSFSIHDDRP